MTRLPVAQTEYLTVAEVAALLRLSKHTVYLMIHDGDIDAIRTGRHGSTYRIPSAALAQHLRAGGTTGPAPHIPGQLTIATCHCEDPATCGHPSHRHVA